MTDTTKRIDVTLVNRFPELQGFGLDISGGNDRPYLADDLGIFVSGIKENGLAQKSGEIHVEDKIIEINGCSVLNVTHDAAVQLFINNRIKVQLVIEKYTGPLTLAMLEDCFEDEVIDEKENISTISKHHKGTKKTKSFTSCISLSGFFFGLLIGCGGIILVRRYLLTSSHRLK